MDVSYPVSAVELPPVDTLGATVDLAGGTFTNLATSVIHATTYIPAMTSNTAPSPFIASASTSEVYGVGPYGAFDGKNIYNSNTIWHSAYPLSITEATPQWLKIKLDQAIRIWKYSIAARNYDSRIDAPAVWDLQGSNDDSTWVTIDSRNEPTGWSMGATREFTIGNIGSAYLYYRLLIKSAGRNNVGGFTIAIVAEFNIYRYE